MSEVPDGRRRHPWVHLLLTLFPMLHSTLDLHFLSVQAPHVRLGCNAPLDSETDAGLKYGSCSLLHGLERWEVERPLEARSHLYYEEGF